MKKPEKPVTYILGIKLPKSRVLWYWCGGANPRFMDPEAANKYTSKRTVLSVRSALIKEGLGTFRVVVLADARVRYRRRQRRLAA